MDLVERAEGLAQLMEERLGLRGNGLAAKLKHSRRLLPRHMRGELGYMAEAMRAAENPKLARQIDHARIEAAADAAERYLRGVDREAHVRKVWLDWVAGNAFNIVVILGVLIAVIAWRGLL